ncbi:hypothetical protein Q7V72_07870, partial [Streptococcus suis]|nr:hypothetical protein [Streptococcus suis]
FDYNRKKKWKLKALAATSIAGGFLVFLYEKNWLEAIKEVRVTEKLSPHCQVIVIIKQLTQYSSIYLSSKYK